MGTPKDNSIYKVKARIGNNEFLIDQIDWMNTTQRNFRFNAPDFKIARDQFKETSNCCLIYEIGKYSLNDMKHEPDFAFAVHPLARNHKG